MNLLIVFHSLYSLAGGVDNRVSQLEIELSKKIKTNLLLFKRKVDLQHTGKIFFIDSLTIPRIILKYKKKLKFIAYIYGIINLFIRIKKTKDFIIENKCNTVLAVDDYFSLIVILATRGLNKKIVCSVRNNWDKLYDNNMIHLLPDFVYKEILPKLMNKYASSIHCVSEELADNLKVKYNIKNVIPIYNFFDFNKIQYLANKENEIKYEYFINIGHFNKQKNQKDLIIMYSELKNKFKIREKLIMIGDGTLIEDCKTLVKNYDLMDDIIFLGKQFNPYKYLSKATLYISTSLYEGLPAVFVESLILKVPIVSYDFQTGAKELCNNLTEQNPYSLANKVYEVLSSNEIILSSKNIEESLISEKFNNNVILNKWLEII